MKNNLFSLLLLICLGATNNAFCQPTAVGGCNTAEVTGGIPTPTNTTPFWTGNFNSLGSGGNQCLRIWYSTSNPCGDGSNDPLFTLQRFNSTNNTWVNVKSQGCPLFTNITTRGRHRIGIQLPVAIPGSGGCAGGFVRVTNSSGTIIGNMGSYTNAPFVFTNTFLVGPTSSSDNNFTFIDPGETGPEAAYDFGEIVKISNLTSTNYDLWYLAIFENGPIYNRSRGIGWSTGTMPNNFNLTNIWNDGNPTTGWKFEQFHTYTVQYVTENSLCRNGIEFNPSGNWNGRDRTFNICPAGTGCRIGEDAQKIVLSPNPASSVVRLLNLEMDEGSEYRLTITDLAGKTVRSNTLSSNEVDITALTSGMYIMTIERNGKRILTDKLVVNNSN